MDKYNSINQDYGPVETREKGSRFIAFGYPITSSNQVKKRIDQLKRQFNDASHFCFAYRLINPDSADSGEQIFYRSNDDGEPGGTAGLPIYNEILRKDYYNILVAVVRYFGGTKLGTGRLSRTYAFAARSVLDITKKIDIYIYKKASVFFPFDLTGDMMQLIKSYSIEIISQDYTPGGVNMRLLIPVCFWDEVVNTVKDTSKGKTKINLDSSMEITGINTSSKRKGS